MATVPSDKKKDKSLVRRIYEFFKHVAEWVPENLGDPAVARTIREDLGLAAGADIPADKQEKFKRFQAGLDVDRAAFLELVEQIKVLVPEIKSLAQDLSSDKVDPLEAEYLLLRLFATDFLRLRAPFLYALYRTVLFLEEDVESLGLIDPAVMLHNLYGEDLPESEVLAQRLSGAGALLLQLVNDLVLGDGESPGHIDIDYGWDASPDTLTPLADLVSMRAMTVRIGSIGSGATLLTDVIYVPPEQGGPGLFLGFGGAVTLTNADNPPGSTPSPVDPTPPPPSTSGLFKIDAAFGSAVDMFIPFKGATLPLRVNHPTLDNPFLKFSMAAGQADTPAFRFGDADGTRIDIYESEFGANASKDGFSVTAAVRNAELVIVAGEGDSFIRTIAGDGAKVRFSAGIVADNDGLHLDGGTRAAVTLPAGRSISGLLTVHHLELSIGPTAAGGDLALSIGGAFTANLGPVAIAVDQLGFELQFERLANPADNNLGWFNLGLGFKPPNGLGLSIKGGAVSGGGYLFIDRPNHEYAGALELQIGQFGLKAIGMLATRPDDSWSLLLLLYVQFPAIQLGFGFTLNGLGGMLGLHHGADTAQLIAGMKTKAFDDILFPDDPVANAPRIINRLRTLFPYTPRALIVAPMLDLGFGTPRFVFIRVGVMVQLENVLGNGPGDVRMSRALLIGELKVLLGPSKSEPDKAVVQLIIDVLGFWDRDAKRYGVIARLRDSKVAGIALTGSLAVYGDYGAQPRQLLAAGGFNPRFKDVPAEIGGVLDRLGAAFDVGRFKLTIAAYFAVTPGTLQFGVDIAVKAKISAVEIKGNIGFDALIYREPNTHFIADFRVSVEVSYKGHSLASVKCVGVVEGPGLWHVTGKVTFSILWWDIDKSFDESWGQSPALGVVTTDVRGLLAAELARPENWTAQLPVGAVAMVSLAPPAADKTLLAHPLGRAVFSQRVVPLGLALQRFGSTQVAGPNKFELSAVKLGGAAVPLTSCPAVQEHFARAQFLDMSEDDKLAKPSFEPMDAGLEFSSATFHPSASVLSAVLDYETAYVDFDEHGFNPTRRDTRLEGLGIDHAVLGVLSRGGAAGRSPKRLDERQAAKTRARISLGVAPLAVATRDTLAIDASVKLAANAQRAVMLAEQRVTPVAVSRVQLVEAFELV